MTIQKPQIIYTTGEKTKKAEFKIQDSFFKISKTDTETYINAYNYKEKAMCCFIGNSENLEQFIKGLQAILEDKKFTL